jgi:hypothetical protein
VLVDAVKRRRVGLWRLKTVLWLALLPDSASSRGHPKVIFRLEKRYVALVSMGTLQHFRPVRGPLLTSKEEVLHGLSCLSTCTLIRLGDIDSIKVFIESRHTSPELS